MTDNKVINDGSIDKEVHVKGVRWAVAGVCADVICATIILQQCLAVGRLSKDHHHLLIDGGIICGGLFLLLVRLMVFQAFQRPFRPHDRISLRGEAGRVESINLLVTTVRSEKDKKRYLIWNLESLLGNRISWKADRDTACFEARVIWEAPNARLLTILDYAFCLAATGPVLALALTDFHRLAIFSAAAINGSIYMLLLLSAQVGIMQWLSRSSVRGIDGQGPPLYQGLFFTLAKGTDGCLLGLLNASIQVQLEENTQYGPYI